MNCRICGYGQTEHEGDGEMIHGFVPDDDRLITVCWRDCDCEWWTKSCEELHTRQSAVPLGVLRQTLLGGDS